MRVYRSTVSYRFLLILIVFVFSVALTVWRFSLYMDPAAFAYDSIRAVASVVGVGAGVSENPYNSLAEELQEKERRLFQKQKELESASFDNAAGREIFKIIRGDRTLIALLFSNGLLLLALFGHLWLDHQRRKKETFGKLM